jgi:hypothetical protein
MVPKNGLLCLPRLLPIYDLCRALVSLRWRKPEVHDGQPRWIRRLKKCGYRIKNNTIHEAARKEYEMTPTKPRLFAWVRAAWCASWIVNHFFSNLPGELLRLPSHFTVNDWQSTVPQIFESALP